MKQIITALDNPELANEIKKDKDLKLLSNDIQYQDGIFEILEKYKKIDYLILSELLFGKYKIEELVSKIKEKNNFIRIIIILENEKENIENLLYSKGVYKIFYNNEIKILDIIQLIKNNKEENNNAKEELEKLKEILLENNIEINFSNENPVKIKNNKIKKIIKPEIEKNKKLLTKKNVISILGTGGVGKSIITLNLAEALRKENKKVLIIDFDVLNNSLHTILNVDKYPKKIKNKLKNNNLINNKIDIKNLIIKIDKNLDLISGINLIFDRKYKISSQKVKYILDELNNFYDYIIIDNTSECFFDYTKNIIKNSDYSIFLLEANLSEIKKAKNLLNLYNKNWNIEINKIKLLINKYNNNSIDDNIIKKLFSKYKIIGKLNYSDKYNILINDNGDKEIFLKDIRKEYKNLINNV